MFSGLDATKVPVGERVTSVVRVYPADSDTKGCVGSVDAIGSSIVHLTGSGGSPAALGGSRSASYIVDRAWGVDAFGASSADMMSAMLPLALGALGGVSASIVHCYAPPSGGAQSQPSWDSLSFFDPQSKRCVALNLFERLVEEATRAGRPAYLSMGAITGVFPREKICDVIGSDIEAMKPLQVVQSPSLVHESIFADIKEVNVSYGRRCAEVFFSGLRSIMAFQSRYTITRNSTLFASIAIPLGEDLQTVSTFTILDVRDPAVMQSSILIDPSLDDPYLGSDAVSLLAYGLRFSNRTMVIASVPSCPTVEDMVCLETAVGVREIATTPHDLVAEMQGLEIIRERLDGRDADECRLYADARELMRHRAMVNRTLHEHQQQTVLFEQLQQDFANLADTLKRTQDNIVSVLPEVLHDLQSDGNTSRVLAARFEAIREMEYMQERERRRLSHWQAELAMLPIRRESGLATLDVDSRTMMLEGTVRTLHEENERLRALFNRDVRILRVELDAAKSQVGVGRSHGAGGASQDYASPLQPLIDSFSEECRLLLRGASVELSTNSEGTVLLQLNQLIDSLSSDLKFNAEILLAPGVSGGLGDGDGGIPQIALTMPNESLFVQAALDKSRRLLGIPVAPPEMRGAFQAPSLTYWRAMVEERAVCRSERWSLQHMSKGLSLNATRLAEGLGGLDAAMQHLGRAISSVRETSRSGHSSKAVSRAQAEINRLIADEMGLGSAEINGAPGASVATCFKELQTLWGQMSLQIRRCGDLARLLSGMSVVPGPEDASASLIPLSYELADEVRGAIEGSGVASASGDLSTQGPDAEAITVSLDGILKGAYRKSAVAPPVAAGRGARQSRVVTQGFFSSELSRRQ